MKKCFCWLLIASASLLYGNGDLYQNVKDSPIHEAFAIKESGTLLLEAVSEAPPPKITELPPPQENYNEIWIPGYWAWSSQDQNYLWVSGVWRKPPPGLQWIPGRWKHYPQGWVHIPGFWSKTPIDQIQYLKTPPPDPLDERIPTPPAEAENYFWIPGTWQYDFELGQYVWYSGRWDLIDVHWNYCPAHYVWQEEGYVFIPGFWDWPMHARGIAFRAIYANPSEMESIVFQPKEVLDHYYIMDQLYPYWPDYTLLFRFHYFFYYDIWISWGAAPSWWNWPTWWAFPVTAQWDLWWWWSHPGYPNPFWLDSTIAQSIAPPPQFVVQMMEKVYPPPYVTSRGTVGRSSYFEALTQVTGSQTPILPSSLQVRRQVQELVHPQKPSSSYMPRGNNQGMNHAPEKPFFGPSPHTLKTAPRRITLPIRPIVTEQKPTTQVKSEFLPLSPISYEDPTIYGSQPGGNFQIQNPGHPVIPYHHPRMRMQSEYHNEIMGHPQFQINPPGPNAHQTPGDYSTLPGQ